MRKNRRFQNYILCFVAVIAVIISTCSVYAEAASKLKISGASKPAKMTEGQDFTVQGKIESNYIITSVDASVYQNGKRVAGKSATKLSVKSYNVKALDFSFKNLGAGEYTYYVSARDTKGKKVLVNQKFTVIPKPYSVKVSTKTVNLDISYTNTQTVTVSQNYPKTCYLQAKIKGTQCASITDKGWNKAGTAKQYLLKGTGKGSFKLVFMLYDNSTKKLVATSDIITINVKKSKIPVTSVKLNKSSITLHVGETGKLSTTVVPSNATNKNVTWSSSNTKVATVSSGTVKGIKKGTATITVTTKDGKKQAKCTVTVVDKGAEAVYAFAKTQLGKKYTDYSEDLGFHSHAWCADFVSWCAKNAGQSKAIPKQASVAGIRSAIKKAGGKEYSKEDVNKGKYVPKRGDIIIFKSSGDSHVGIVDYVSKKTIYYIDGNNITYGNGNKSSVHYSKCSFSYKGFTCVLKPNYK